MRCTLVLEFEGVKGWQLCTTAVAPHLRRRQIDVLVNAEGATCRSQHWRVASCDGCMPR